MLGKEQIQGLRDLNPGFVRKTLEEAGVPLHPTDKKIKNGIDVAVHMAGWPYQEAIEKMAELFPEAVEAGAKTGLSTCEAAVAEAKRQAEASGKRFRDYKQGEFGWDFWQDVFKWWKALRLKSIDIHTNISREAEALAIMQGKSVMDTDKPDSFDETNTRRIPRLNAKDATLYDVIRWTPLIMAISAAGRTEEAPTTVYCAPKWDDDMIGIMIEDLGKCMMDPEKPDDYDRAYRFVDKFTEKYPPTAKVYTSDRLPQLFYVLKRKYPEQEFYDAFMARVNAKNGDPKVTRQGWDTRLAGLYNRKKFMRDGSGRTPKCRLGESSTRYPIEMERAIDAFRPIWEEEQRQKAEHREKMSVVSMSAASSPEPVRNEPPVEASFSALQASGEGYGFNSKDELKARLEEAFEEGGNREQGMKNACAVLEEVPVPDYIYKTGKNCEANRVAIWNETNKNAQPGDFRYTDRSEVDAFTARALYYAGATPHEVYSYMLHHACQNEEMVLRENGWRQRVRDEKDRDHKARRTALNLAPTGWFKYGWRTENMESWSIGSLADPLVFKDDEYRRRMRIMNPVRPRKAPKPLVTRRPPRMGA